MSGAHRRRDRRRNGPRGGALATQRGTGTGRGDEGMAVSRAGGRRQVGTQRGGKSLTVLPGDRCGRQSQPVGTDSSRGGCGVGTRPRAPPQAVTGGPAGGTDGVRPATGRRWTTARATERAMAQDGRGIAGRPGATCAADARPRVAANPVTGAPTEGAGGMRPATDRDRGRERTMARDAAPAAGQCGRGIRGRPGVAAGRTPPDGGTRRAGRAVICGRARGTRNGACGAPAGTWAGRRGTERRAAPCARRRGAGGAAGAARR